MKPQENIKSSWKPPKQPILVRILSWTKKQWEEDPRPLFYMALTIIVGILATLYGFSSGWFFILWFFLVISVVFFGVLYFIWNLASIALILLLERKTAEEWELILIRYWFKRNLIITGLWSSLLILSVIAQPGWPLLATINTVSLSFIIMFAESEDSPFEKGDISLK